MDLLFDPSFHLSGQASLPSFFSHFEHTILACLRQLHPPQKGSISLGGAIFQGRAPRYPNRVRVATTSRSSEKYVNTCTRMEQHRRAGTRGRFRSDTGRSHNQSYLDDELQQHSSTCARDLRYVQKTISSFRRRDEEWGEAHWVQPGGATRLMKLVSVSYCQSANKSAAAGSPVPSKSAKSANICEHACLVREQWFSVHRPYQGNRGAADGLSTACTSTDRFSWQGTFRAGPRAQGRARTGQGRASIRWR